jgi:hypothetical protein
MLKFHTYSILTFVIYVSTVCFIVRTRNGNLLKCRVSGIRVNQIHVNQGDMPTYYPHFQSKIWNI